MDEVDTEGQVREILDSGELRGLVFPELEIRAEDVRTGPNPVHILHFHGKITNQNSYTLNRKIPRLLEKNPTRLILDFEKLEYMNSTGVAIFFSICYRVRENEGRVVVGGMHPFLRKIFGMMEMPAGLEVLSSIADARGVFDRS